MPGARPYRMPESWLPLMNDAIIACVGTPAERHAIVSGAGPLRVQFCSGLREMYRAPTAVGGRIMVVEILAEVDQETRRFVNAVLSRHWLDRILVRFATPHGLAAFFAEPDAYGAMAISLSGFDSLEDDIARLRSAAGPVSPRTTIVSSAAQAASPAVRDIVLTCLVMGERRTSVAEVAARCARSGRRMAEVLVASGTPGAKQLLMWSLATNTQWRVAQLGWTGKRAAIEAGFPSSDVLSKRIKRAIGSRLADACRSETFETTLGRLVQSLARHRVDGVVKTTDSRSRADFGDISLLSAVVRMRPEDSLPAVATEGRVVATR